MSNNRKAFINNLFQKLDSKDYMLLKFTEKNISEIDESSDLDIFWNNKSNDVIHEIASRECTVIKVSVHAQSFMKQLFIFFQDGGFLQIDCLYQLIRKNLVYLPKEYLLSQKVEKDGISTYHDFCLFEHIVLFNQLNFAGIPQKYFEYFNSFSSQKIQSLIIQFNQKYNTEIVELSELNTVQKELREKVVKSLNNQKDNKFFPKQFSTIKYVFDSVTNLKQRRGFLISFSGVDGAGKSTILEATRRMLSEKFRQKTVVVRHRPSLLPILSSFVYGKKQAENRAASRLPRQGNNSSKINSIFRFSYYFADYLFGRSYIFFKYQLRNYIVLYDRYYFDFIVDSKRTNLELNKWIPTSLYRLVQKPTLNFFLFAPADIILQRKQELLPEAIESLTKGYQDLFSQLGTKYKQSYLAIENINQEETLNFISKKIIKEI